MNRDVVLVTGGNSGIGFECARQLARQGWHVFIASRNREISAQAVRQIAQESGAKATSESGLDLGSFASVRAFAKEIERQDLPLRALVCNARLQIIKGPQLSLDGFECTFDEQEAIFSFVRQAIVICYDSMRNFSTLPLSHPRLLQSSLFALLVQ